MQLLLRRPVVLIACATALVGIIGALIWWVVSSPSPQASSRPEPLTASQAAQLSADVTSGEPSRLRQAIAMPADQTLDPAAAKALAQLKISLNAATFQLGDGRTAKVTGTVVAADGSTSDVTFMLVSVDGRWLLLDGLVAT